MSKRYQATCYYVLEEKNWRWGYFRITPEIGLLQIHSDFGIYAHRWEASGPDFKAFLMRMGYDHLSGCLESTVPHTVTLTTQRAAKQVSGRVGHLLEHLWPLFIEQLKAEQAEAGVA